MRIHMESLIFEVTLNIALLVLVATLLSKLQVIQTTISQERRSFAGQVFLAAVFGAVIILSVYTGIEVGGYNMNTRVIAAIASGILGGPVVGMYASMIGAVYVYFLSGDPAFAMASAFSTVLFGLLGGGFYPYFQRGKWKYRDLFFLTCFAEICDLVIILRMVNPFSLALETVMQAGPLMTVMNAVGILLFISSFNHIFIRQDIESSRQLQRASELAKRCIPLLGNGLRDKENMERLVGVLMESSGWTGVILTDKEKILAWEQKEEETEGQERQFWPGSLPGQDGQDQENRGREGAASLPEISEIPEIGREAMEKGELLIAYKVPKTSAWYEWMKDYSMIAAPFLIEKEAIGSLIVWTKKQWVFRQSDVELLQNLVEIASAQIALSELERQRMLRQQAEFKALQFQVNPHFLFNALNTISYVCRENSGRARELLVILAEYFRYNLGEGRYMVPMEEELKHVRDYLEIEKARFEDKLEVTYDLPETMDIRIPTLILQPIVENAVRYGIGRDGKRKVHIAAERDPGGIIVTVRDQGKGFQEEILEKLERGEPVGGSIGLRNVDQRMKRTYGEDHGIQISSTDEGSCVRLWFLKECRKETKEGEICGNDKDSSCR